MFEDEPCTAAVRSKRALSDEAKEAKGNSLEHLTSIPYTKSHFRASTVWEYFGPSVADRHTDCHTLVLNPQPIDLKSDCSTHIRLTITLLFRFRISSLAILTH